MSASLNNIADQIADAKGKSFDFPFKQRVKQVFIQQFATYMKQQINKDGRTTAFVQYYLADLIHVDIVDQCDIVLGCTVMRTKNKVFKPIRFSSPNFFEFVGDVNGKAFSNVPLRIKNEVASLRFMKKVIKYDWRNDYIYVWVPNKINKIKIGAAFESPHLVSSDCVTGTCWDDDMEFPMPADMIQSIKERLFAGEFKIDISDTDETKVELDDNKNDNR